MAVSVELVVEALYILVLAGILSYLWLKGREVGVAGEPGWSLFLLGLALLLLSGGIDIVDELRPALAQDPGWERVEDVTTDLVLPVLGASSIAVGLVRWIPLPARLKETQSELEDRVEERTAELAASEARFRAIAENVDAAFWLAEVGEGFPADAEMTYLSPGYEELFEQPREEVEEAPFEAWLERVHPDDRDRIQRELGGRSPPDLDFEIEYRIETPGEDVRWLHTHGVTVNRDRGGEELLLAGITEDVTDRRRRQESLEEETAFLDRMMDAFPDLVYVLDDDGALRRWNRRLPEVTGYDDEEIADMEATDFFAPGDDRERIAEAVAETLEEGTTRIEMPFLTKDGESIPYEFFSARTTDLEGETIIVGTGRDITDRLERERELREVRREYESIFENVQEGLWLMEVDGGEPRIERFNPTQEEITGLATEEVEGKTLEEAFGPDLAAKVEPNYRRCIDEGEPISYEEELAFGDETRIFHTRLIPVVEEGEVVEIVGSARDVTEARRYEERIESERDQLEVLNRLLRHDIRNDMTAVLSVADILLEDAPETVREDLERMIAAGEHVVELTDTARDLVEVIRRGESFQTEPTPLAETLEGEVDHVRDLYQDARFEVAGEVPDVDVQAGPLLTSVFRNILNNAVLHNDEETPEVRVEAAVDGDEVEVRIADNGPGVSEAVRETLFEAPDDPMDPESSMGLYLVQRVVSAYGGTIRLADDGEAGGATFVATLPLADTG